jgi:hypothetical protein
MVARVRMKVVGPGGGKVCRLEGVPDGFDDALLVSCVNICCIYN